MPLQRGRLPDGGLGRRYMEWERPPNDVFRFQELGSDDEAELTQGVLADPFYQNPKLYPGEYLLRTASFGAPPDDDSLAYYTTDYATDDDYRAHYAQQLLAREQEELLAQRALDRIRRAKLDGKPNVSLSHEELEALELGRIRSGGDHSPPRPSSKSKSTTPKNSVRSKKGPAAPSALFAASTATRSKASKSGRKRSSTIEESMPQPAPLPPGFIIAGPGGTPIYAPPGYDPRVAAAQQGVRPVRSGSISRPGSRSASSSGRQQHTPPPAMYEATPGAFPTYASPLRPTSSSSRQSTLVDDLEQRARRSRSSSSASYSQQIHTPYQVDPATGYQYATAPAGAPALQSQGAPAAYVQRHRLSSGAGLPADVAYATIPRRVTVGAAAAPPVVPRIPASNSDPTLGGGVAYRVSARNHELSEDTEEDGMGTDETDEGVRLDVGGAGDRRANAGASTRKASGSSRRHSVSNGHAHGSSSRHGHGTSSGEKGRHRKGKK